MEVEVTHNCVAEFLDLHRGIFSDAIVVCENGYKVNVNKIVLAAYSSFFRRLFSTTLEHEYKREFLIPEVTKDGLKPIIDWMYHKKIILNDENILHVLKDADFLNVTSVIKLCSNYFEKEMTINNVFGIRKWADHYNLKILSIKSNQFIHDHFETICKEEEFLTLTEEELCSILEDDRLNISDEIIAWKAAIRWLKNSPTLNSSLKNVLKNIRFGLMSHDYVVHFVANDLQSLTPIIEPILKDAYLYFKTRYIDNGSADLTMPTPYIATPRRPHEFLFVLGGWSGSSPSKSIEVYDKRSDRWRNFALSLPMPLSYSAAVNLGNWIYLIGGITQDESVLQRCSRFCYKIDLNTELITEMSPMMQRRNFVSLVNIGSTLYAIGGKSNTTEDSRLRTCEKMITTASIPKWEKIKSMKIVRSDLGAVVINGQIYVVGGFDGETVHRSVEVYSPKDNKWSFCSDMVCRRTGVRCIEFRGELYVVGGSDGISRLRSIEKFCPTTKKWTVLSPMKYPRSNHGLRVVEGKLYAIGGYTGIDVTDNVECYDFEEDKWFVADPLLFSKSGMATICMERNFLDESLQVKCVYANKGDLFGYNIRREQTQSEIMKLEEVEGVKSDSSSTMSDNSDVSSFMQDELDRIGSMEEEEFPGENGDGANNN